MNRNLNRRIHPIAEADGLSPKKPRKLCVATIKLVMKHFVALGQKMQKT